jgi:hypothetical protein
MRETRQVEDLRGIRASVIPYPEGRRLDERALLVSGLGLPLEPVSSTEGGKQLEEDELTTPHRGDPFAEGVRHPSSKTSAPGHSAISHYRGKVVGVFCPPPRRDHRTAPSSRRRLAGYHRPDR